jgi:thioredoxin-related protein
MNIKNILSVLLMTISLGFSSNLEFANEYTYSTNYQESLSKAKISNQPLMILFVTTSCPWCKKLENQTLSKEYINSFVQANFIPLILDKEKDSFPKHLEPQVVPTVHFINPKNEQSFGQILGYKPHKEFYELLQKAQKRYEE